MSPLLSLTLNHPPCSQKPGSIVSLQYPPIDGLGLLWIPDLCFSPRLLVPSPSPSLGSGSSGQSLPSFLLLTWRSTPASVELSPGHREWRPSPVTAGSLSLTLLSWPGLAWRLPASAGLEALRSLRLAWRHLSEVDIDVFLEIFTMILSRIEDLVLLALYNHNM